MDGPSQQQFLPLLAEICENAKNFKHFHVKKVAIPALLSLIFDNSEENIVKNRLFEAVIDIINAKETKKPSKKHKIRRKRKGFSSSDEEIVDSAIHEAFHTPISDQNSSEADFTRSLSSISSPLHNFNEISHFQSTLQSASHHHPQLTTQLIARLTPHHKSALKSLLETRQIPISDGLSSQTTAFRRITTVTRRLR